MLIKIIILFNYTYLVQGNTKIDTINYDINISKITMKFTTGASGGYVKVTNIYILTPVTVDITLTSYYDLDEIEIKNNQVTEIHFMLNSINDIDNNLNYINYTVNNGVDFIIDQTFDIEYSLYYINNTLRQMNNIEEPIIIIMSLYFWKIYKVK